VSIADEQGTADKACFNIDKRGIVLRVKGKENHSKDKDNQQAY
jgi:hypothetical protein